MGRVTLFSVEIVSRYFVQLRRMARVCMHAFQSVDGDELGLVQNVFPLGQIDHQGLSICLWQTEGEVVSLFSGLN